MKKPCFGGGASPKAFETSAPKTNKFSAAAFYGEGVKSGNL
jgi:hypothetical protein